MIKPALLLLIASMLPPLANAQVYKCEIGDDTLYQQRPCPGVEAPMTGGAITTYKAPDYQPLRRTAPSPPQSAQPQSSNSYQSSIDRRNARVQARARGEIVPGMTTGQLYAMLGEPSSKSDVTRSDGERCERWAWVNPRFVERNYYSATICNGIVK